MRLTRRELEARLDAHSATEPVDLSHHDLRDANLSRRDLSGGRFVAANLRGADLSASDFSGADFSDASLVGADLSGATLHGASLRFADLSNANTAEASFHGADMTGMIQSSKGKRHPSGREDVTEGFPKLFYYGGNGSSGSPLMTAPNVYDTQLIAQVAKWHLISINTVPWTNLDTAGYPAIVQQIRGRYPRSTNRLILYNNFQWAFVHVSSTMYGDQWNYVKGTTPGFPGPDTTLFFDAGHGGLPFPFNDPNAVFYDLPKCVGPNGAVGGQAVLNLWKRYCKGFCDGYFFDTIVFNAESYTAGCAVPPGYSTLAEANAACVTASRIVTDGLVGTGLMYGNRGHFSGYTPDADALKWNGEMAEGWDPGQGFDGDARGPMGFSDYDAAIAFFTALWPNGGAIIKAEDPTAVLPSSPILVTDTNPSNVWGKLARYALGSACLVGGYFWQEKGNRDATSVYAWADEYAVKPTGQATTDVGFMGWLGQPVEAAHKDAGGCWVRRFERGAVVVNGGFPLYQTNSFDLGRPYRRITGNTSINNGAVEQTGTLQRKDARFYVAL